MSAAITGRLFPRGRIDVNHAVLDLRKALFHGIMDALRRLMRGTQGFAAIRTDFHVNIHAVTEQPCFQLVDTQNTGLTEDGGADFGKLPLAAGMVGHFGGRIPKNIERRF